MSVGDFNIRIDLLAPVIVSADAATSGLLETLGYLPGSLLLGAVAAELYEQEDLTIQDRRDLFHGGAVRFGDARPVAPDGLESRPVPFALHRPKLGQGWVKSRLGAEVKNLAAREDRASDTQWVQLRDGHVSAKGQQISVRKIEALKTAINPAKGRAAQAQLFGLAAIRSRQSFKSTIRTGDLRPEVLHKLKALFDGRELRLGRSRSAEFGTVRCQIEPRTDGPAAWPKCDNKDVRVIWVLADIVVPNGLSSSLTERLGLKGKLIPDKSFVRWRSHMPFNGHWKRRGPERVCIVRGSVIVVERDPDDDVTCAMGLGLEREAGFGEISCDDQMIAFARSGPRDPSGVNDSAPSAATEPPKPVARSALAIWAEKSARSTVQADDLRLAVSTQLEKIKVWYQTAARLAGGANFDVGPSSSQWGDVRKVIVSSKTLAEVKNSLFGKDGCARTDHDDWKISIGGNKTFSQALEELLETGALDLQMLSLVAKDIASAVRDNQRSR